MTRFKKELISTLEKYKCKTLYEPLKCIPIYDANTVCQGYLRPITLDYQTTVPGCAELLAKWRNENAEMSPDPFTATSESTGKWLDHAVLNREDRVLFLIQSIDGTKIGHIGFSCLEEKEQSMEIDAVIRGKKDGYPGMMTFALNSLIHWGLDQLKLKKITLRVLSGNSHAIRFYKRNFFFKTGEIPLYQSIGTERELWTDQKQNGDQVPEKSYTRMQLDIEKWKRNDS